VLVAHEALFFGRGDHLAVYQECGGRVVAKRAG
jgi:hypothetical protein